MARGTPNQLAERLGVHPETVRIACKLGKIPAEKKGRGWIIKDLGAAEQIWNGALPEDGPVNLDEPRPISASLPDDYDGRDAEDSTKVERFWKAKSAELDYRKRLGMVIEISEVQERYAAEASLCKQKLMSVANQFQQRVQLSLADYQLLESMVREALESLSDGYLSE